MITLYKNINYKKFVILTTQRSGSSWLVELLNSHPELQVFSEIFMGNPYGKTIWNDERIIPFYEFRKQNPPGKRPWSTFQYLSTLEDYVENHSAVGFKLMYDQIKWNPEILVSIILDSFKIVHLVRNNYLDVILSRENAWTKRGNQIVHTQKKVELTPIYLNTSSLLKKLAQQEYSIKKYKIILKLLPNPVLTVSYESLCKDTDFVLNSISSFLNVQALNVNYKSNKLKISQRGYKNKIVNYKEVKKLLKDTRFENFLKDD